MKRNVDKNKKRVKNKDNLRKILDDLSSLKLAYDKDTFDRGCKLLLEKWNTDEPEMIQYIENEWINQNVNWYNGVITRTPTDNNGQENYHGKIKVHETAYQLKGINQFKETMLEIVAKRSRRYKENDLKPYVLESTIEKKTMAKGLEYSAFKQVLDRAQNWKKATCTCPEFSNSFMCKHIICIAYQLGLLERPVQRREQFLQANSKRGRPPKARKGGLNMQ